MDNFWTGVIAASLFWVLFARLWVRIEREACAKVCDELAADAAKEQDFHRKPPTQDLSAPLTVNGVPMYPQREWQTLTDEEMFSLWVKCPAETEDRFAFARAIEQALKEKNNG